MKNGYSKCSVFHACSFFICLIGPHLNSIYVIILFFMKFQLFVTINFLITGCNMTHILGFSFNFLCLNQIFSTSFCKVIQSFYSDIFNQSKKENQLTAFDSSSWCNWICYSTNTRLPGYLHFPSVTLIITWRVQICGLILKKEYNFIQLWNSRILHHQYILEKLCCSILT